MSAIHGTGVCDAQHMRIKYVRVGHFRCLQNCEIAFSRFTAMVGPNGVGKSTVLEAIRYFFSPRFTLGNEDLNPNCIQTPIRVTIGFHELNEREANVYSGLIVNGLLEVTKVSEYLDDAWSGRYEVEDFVHPAFDEIRSKGGALAVRRAYAEFAARHPPYQLVTAGTIAVVNNSLRAWELSHRDQCAKRPVRFDFANQNGVSLAQCTLLVYIPAVRDARAEIDGAKSPLQEIWTPSF